VSLRIASAAVAADSAFHSGRAIAGNPALHSLPDGEGEAEREAVDVTFEPMGDQPAITWVASPADRAAEVSVALESERRATLGDHGHRHEPGGCGFCRRAVAAYR
jgi:hypothetical protein